MILETALTLATHGNSSVSRAARLYRAGRRSKAYLPYQKYLIIKSNYMNLGDRVRKTKGSNWQGIIVGTYSTTLTPVGFCVESERETGSVQIYPEGALELVPNKL